MRSWLRVQATVMFALVVCGALPARAQDKRAMTFIDSMRCVG